MTPKEKMLELLDEFVSEINTSDFHIPKYIEKPTEDRTYEIILTENTDLLAWQCAIVCVKNILKEKPSYKYWDTFYDEDPSAITFWNEVKNELENYGKRFLTN